MALNKKMHPRNPYKTPPSFKDLALKNEEFRQHAVIEISGKVSIDFKNADALRALTRALLKEDWQLDVTLPSEYLVPTLPLRLNYILWLEDLVTALKLEDSGSPVYGIDIGTGASCIYPLLASKKNGWHMIGMEKDAKCFAHAQQNVLQNKLGSLVKVCKNDGETIIDTSIVDGAFQPMPDVFHFTMCNPPFFASEEDMEKTNKSRSAKCPRPPPHNARTGSANEVVVEGGEVAFVYKMIDESMEVKSKIRIFTTMLGHKSSFSKVLKYLKDKNISEVASTEFCQGHVTRWGLAWSHSEKLTCELLSTEPVGVKQKPKPPLRFVIPSSTGDSIANFDSLLNEVMLLMKHLNMVWKCVIKDKKSVGYQVTAVTNTWSNQRKKRRDQLRKTTESVKDEPQVIEGASSEPTLNVTGNTLDKNQWNSEDDDEPPVKKAKVTEPVPVAVMGLILREEQTEDGNTSTILEMNWLHGTGGRESVHQIMQYFKNNLKEK